VGRSPLEPSFPTYDLALPSVVGAPLHPNRALASNCVLNLMTGVIIDSLCLCSSSLSTEIYIAYLVTKFNAFYY